MRYTCLAVFVIIGYRVITENGTEYERQWTCEELHAKDLLIQLVSIRIIGN